MIHIVPGLPVQSMAEFFRPSWVLWLCGSLVEPRGLAGCGSTYGDVAAGASMILGGIAQMLTPAIKRRPWSPRITANRTPFFPRW